MRRFFLLSVASLSFLSILSCKKVEGKGGSSTITGKIHAIVRDGAGNILKEYDFHEEDVYIIYSGEGDESMYDDDIKTSYDGTFRFDYLQNGNYQVFVYEKCSSCPSGKQVIIKTVEITEKKSTVDLGTINVEK